MDLTNITTPTKVGVFLPDRVPAMAPEKLGPAPEVLDAKVLPDGTLIVSDGYSGLCGVRFDPTLRAPAAAEGERFVRLDGSVRRRARPRDRVVR